MQRDYAVTKADIDYAKRHAPLFEKEYRCNPCNVRCRKALDAADAIAEKLNKEGASAESSAQATQQPLKVGMARHASALSDLRAAMRAVRSKNVMRPVVGEPGMPGEVSLTGRVQVTDTVRQSEQQVPPAKSKIDVVALPLNPESITKRGKQLLADCPFLKAKWQADGAKKIYGGGKFVVSVKGGDDFDADAVESFVDSLNSGDSSRAIMAMFGRRHTDPPYVSAAEFDAKAMTITLGWVGTRPKFTEFDPSYQLLQNLCRSFFGYSSGRRVAEVFGGRLTEFTRRAAVSVESPFDLTDFGSSPMSFLNLFTGARAHFDVTLRKRAKDVVGQAQEDWQEFIDKVGTIPDEDFNRMPNYKRGRVMMEFWKQSGPFMAGHSTVDATVAQPEVILASFVRSMASCTRRSLAFTDRPLATDSGPHGDDSVKLGVAQEAQANPSPIHTTAIEEFFSQRCQDFFLSGMTGENLRAAMLGVLCELHDEERMQPIANLFLRGGAAVKGLVALEAFSERGTVSAEVKGINPGELAVSTIRGAASQIVRHGLQAKFAGADAKATKKLVQRAKEETVRIRRIGRDVLGSRMMSLPPRADLDERRNMRLADLLFSDGQGNLSWYPRMTYSQPVAPRNAEIKVVVIGSPKSGGRLDVVRSWGPDFANALAGLEEEDGDDDKAYAGEAGQLKPQRSWRPEFAKNERTGLMEEKEEAAEGEAASGQLKPRQVIVRHRHSASGRRLCVHVPLHGMSDPQWYGRHILGADVIVVVEDGAASVEEAKARSLIRNLERAGGVHYANMSDDCFKDLLCFGNGPHGQTFVVVGSGTGGDAAAQNADWVDAVVPVKACDPAEDLDKKHRPRTKPMARFAVAGAASADAIATCVAKCRPGRSAKVPIGAGPLTPWDFAYPDNEVMMTLPLLEEARGEAYTRTFGVQRYLPQNDDEGSRSSSSSSRSSSRSRSANSEDNYRSQQYEDDVL